MLSDNKFERFAVFPNESVDKLTVNRSFGNLYDEIASKNVGEFPITVESATESTYGLIRYSSLDSYLRTAPESDEERRKDYMNRAMGISAVSDFSGRITGNGAADAMFSYSSLPPEQTTGWLRVGMGHVSLLDMPNGTKMLAGDVDITLSNLRTLFGTPTVTSEKYVQSAVVTGSSTVLNLTTDDRLAIDDFSLDTDNSLQSRADVANLVYLNGREIAVPYFTPLTAHMRHNVCGWTTYSSFKRSYVETVFSMEFDVAKMLTQFYDFRSYTTISPDDKTDNVDFETPIDRPLEELVFSNTPIVMAQLSFYNNETRPLATFGESHAVIGGESTFLSTNSISEKELTVSEKDGYELTPVNGNVIYKGCVNSYRPNGKVYNNTLKFDASMKFMVGGAYDPLMVDGLCGINAKARMQFLMIGV